MKIQTDKKIERQKENETIRQRDRHMVKLTNRYSDIEQIDKLINRQ